MPAGTRTLQAVDVTSDSNHTAVTRLGGFSLRSGGAAAACNLRHATVSGQILAVVNMVAAAESQTVIFDGYVDAPSGVYVQVTTGAIAGVLYDME